MALRLPDCAPILRLQPGARADRSVPAVSLNPFEPEPGFNLQSHADLVRALFVAAFEADEPFPQVLSEAMAECYTSAGWDLASGDPWPEYKPKFYVDDPDEPRRPRYPTLREFQSAARQVVQRIGYGPEVAANVKGFVDVRIGSLRQGTPGRFFEGGHPLDLPALLRRNVVLELDSVTDDQEKAFVIGIVVIRIVEHLRVNRKNAPGLQHILLIEEAHRLLKRVSEGPAAASVDLFASMLAEIRAYGEGVVVVEQIPSKIFPDVIKNTALKVMHRLPALDDREVVGGTMNLTPEGSQAVVSLTPGLAVASVDGDDRPLLIRIPGGIEREGDGRPDAHLVTMPALLGRRSLLCGKECQLVACDSEILAKASRIARTSPALVIYGELVALSLILNLAPPKPTAKVFLGWPKSSREIDCMLAIIADRSAEARRAYLQIWIDADDFAYGLYARLAELLVGRQVDLGDVRRFQAGPSRWADIELVLKAKVEAQAGGKTEGVTSSAEELAEWNRRGCYVVEGTPAEQLAQIHGGVIFAFTQQAAYLGDVQVSGLYAAVRQATREVTLNSVQRALVDACGQADSSTYARWLVGLTSTRDQ